MSNYVFMLGITLVCLSNIHPSLAVVATIAAAIGTLVMIKLDS